MDHAQHVLELETQIMELQGMVWDLRAKLEAADAKIAHVVKVCASDEPCCQPGATE